MVSAAQIPLSLSRPGSVMVEHSLKLVFHGAGGCWWWPVGFSGSQCPQWVGILAPARFLRFRERN